MKITVEGTPQECEALQQVLTGAARLDEKVEIELVTITTVVESPPKIPLVLIDGGLSDRQRRAIELPKF